MTHDPWNLYTQQRRLGLRCPPSVTPWTDRDARRQREAERRIAQQRREARGEPGPTPTERLVPWGPR